MKTCYLLEAEYVEALSQLLKAYNNLLIEKYWTDNPEQETKIREAKARINSYIHHHQHEVLTAIDINEIRDQIDPESEVYALFNKEILTPVEAETIYQYIHQQEALNQLSTVQKFRQKVYYAMREQLYLVCVYE